MTMFGHFELIEFYNLYSTKVGWLTEFPKIALDNIFL